MAVVDKAYYSGLLRACSTLTNFFTRRLNPAGQKCSLDTRASGGRLSSPSGVLAAIFLITKGRFYKLAFLNFVTWEDNMSERTITIAFQDYDHTRALVDGKVSVEGFALKVVTLSPPSQIFLRMLNQEEFDASEMSLSNYMISLGHGDRRFVAIPVFPSRVFRHSYVWVNTNAGIREPRDLIGKRVGIADYSMTALLFIRGMLKHEYNVLPEEIHWFRRRSEHVSIKAPATLRIDNIEKDQTLDDLLEEGKLDAVAVTSPPRAFKSGSPLVRRLFSDARQVEADYYRRTKIFPIMHLVVLRRALYEKNPLIAPALAYAFQRAKRQAHDRLTEGLTPTPWVNLDLEYAQHVMGADIYPYGVKANLHTLEAATLYSYEQGLTERRFDVNELFAVETLDLFDDSNPVRL
jgi:4,5-dihydroxyphthalate decarboxylase